jgi:hypothetical protein
MSTADDPVVTYETRPAPALQFLVNFGVVTGREATQLDVRKLSETLLELLPTVTILSEHRFEVGEPSPAVVHGVRVEVHQHALPPEEPDVEALRAELTDVIRSWASSCVSGFAGAELTDPELAAREAVLEMNAEPVWR